MAIFQECLNLDSFIVRLLDLMHFQICDSNVSSLSYCSVLRKKNNLVGIYANKIGRQRFKG